VTLSARGTVAWRALVLRLGLLLVGVGLLVPQVSLAALPANEVWREGLLTFRGGYGRLATGGAGGTLCTVSNLNDAGAGSLRTCLNTPGPQWIIFSVSGTINITSDRIMPLPPDGNDKTIDGRKANIAINLTHTTSGNDGFYLSGLSNWIVHNVAFTNFSSDWSIRLLNADTVWFDHVTTMGGPTNTALGIGMCGGYWGCDSHPSTNITISWSVFHDRTTGSGMVLYAQGSNTTTAPPPETLMAGARLTMHHNWYQHGADARFPLMRWGWCHSYNNYFDNTDFGAQVRAQGQFHSENDIFDCTGPADGHECGFSGILLRVQCTGNIFGETDASNCKVTNPWRVAGTETYEQLNTGTIFTPAADYAYTLDTPNATLRSRLRDVTTGAGLVANPYSTVTTKRPRHSQRWSTLPRWYPSATMAGQGSD
jgi:pectate lyase